MGMNHDDIFDKNKKYTLASWKAQKDWKPFTVSKAEGVYIWDINGKKFLDWSSQLVNVNIGHGNKHVIKAINEQLAKFCYVAPYIATEARAKLGEMLKNILPIKDGKAFFTNGGAEAIENAMKMARLYTGRQKVISRFRSYHGATFGSMIAGGDPRRLANEPGIPWVVHFHGPYSYRNPVYRGRTIDEAEKVLGDLLEDTVLYEGPEHVAAILLEGYSGTSGILQGGKVFWNRVQEICDKYDILLIIDEVMSGFGRTGEWFGINHQPQVKPDLMALAKGITSAYIPLGATIASGKIAKFFEDHVLECGLTTSSHTVALAAAVATLEVMHQEKLVERSQKMGGYFESKLKELQDKHPCVGEIRGAGLHFIIELVKNRESREPMSPFNKGLTEPMQLVAKSLQENGLFTLIRWNWIFCTPPLIISEEQIQEGIDIIDKALSIADNYVEK